MNIYVPSGTLIMREVFFRVSQRLKSYHIYNIYKQIFIFDNNYQKKKKDDTKLQKKEY